MDHLNSFSGVTAKTVAEAAERYGTPLYLYDETMLIEKCKALMGMPNAFGLTVRYAMKANSNRRLLKAISNCGLHIDASSLNEARRAHLAGIPYAHIILTTQEVPLQQDRKDLEGMMAQGLLYNACSLRQLQLAAPFAGENGIRLAMRIHPGVGSGESASRNTGDDYSCFGIHLTDIAEAIGIAKANNAVIGHVHTHIGSGGDPACWRENIDRELGILLAYFPDADTISFGGGLKEARMPGETAADIQSLGAYAKRKIEEFYAKTGRKLRMEIEPGTYIMANAGYAVTKVMDKKRTGPAGWNFLIVDGGMELNARPLLYGSQHPFYILSEDGAVLSGEFDGKAHPFQAVIAGRCCESGDCQSLDESGRSIARGMAEPQIGGYVVIGGAGAYCSAMAPMNYNSHVQAPEVLLRANGVLELIRKRQTLEQMIENER